MKNAETEMSENVREEIEEKLQELKEMKRKRITQENNDQEVKK
jgi:hypothetical protein